MSTARALANQKLYHARILASAWRSALAQEHVAATVLSEAFDPPCRRHLQQAYGWFLLEIVQPGSLPASPPANCGELPTIAAGKATPPEIGELERLESSGWIAEILLQNLDRPKETRSHGNLATSAASGSGPDAIDGWIEQLQVMFERMSHALDEY